MQDNLDPISLALVQNRLDYIARQMGWVMIRTSRSPIFNQSHDFSCFITDASGTLISQADGIPIHTGGGGFSVRALLQAMKGRIAEGDCFLLNDPYVAGGNHLPDWVIARPVFAASELVAFTCNRAHQSDIGGGAAGTYNPAATEIFHEGIRLPVLKLVDRGETRDDLWQLLMINTRCPELLDGDLRAMMGSTQIGADQVVDLVSKVSIEQAKGYFAGILDHADRRFRAAVSALPDGVYRSEESYETDCFESKHVRICVSITIDRDRMTVDFTGTDPQIRGFKNSSLANTYSAVYAALASFFDADIPRNEGTFRAVQIVAPEGTVVNAKPPAPLTMCTVFPAHEIIHSCWWALGQAAPERNCAGWGKNSFPNSSGRDASGRTWVMYHWGGLSGTGAVRGRDGFNQLGPLVTLGGLVLPNAETYEQLYPVHVIQQELRCDGGGAGQYRGGTGVEYEVLIESPSEYSFRAEGVVRPTGAGVQGGRSGAVGRLAVEELGSEPKAPPQYGLWRVGPSILRMASPGGGGYGDPLEREPDAVARDVRDGLVSPAAALEAYGVVLDEAGHADLQATAMRA
jgi:N-methylhydantoinase B